jgi:hypothetical protein
MSFTYDSLEILLENYERLKNERVLPEMSINHGPTVSLYYLDPDGNRIELQLDVFETPEEVAAFMATPLYQKNPIGVDIDPDEMLTKLRSGAPAAELIVRTS